MFKIAEKAVQLSWEAGLSLPEDAWNVNFSAYEPEAFAREYAITAKNTFLRSYRQIAAMGVHDGFSLLVFLQPTLLLEPVEMLSESDNRIRL